MQGIDPLPGEKRAEIPILGFGTSSTVGALASLLNLLILGLAVLVSVWGRCLLQPDSRSA